MMQKVRDTLKRKVEQLKHDEEMMLRMEENYKQTRTEQVSSAMPSESKNGQKRNEREETGGCKRKV